MKVLSALGALSLLLSGCSMLGNGNASNGNGFDNVTNQVGAWDMCKVLPPDPVFDKASGAQYIDGFTPHHVGLRSAMNAEAISCSFAFESPLIDDDDYADVDVLLSVFPGVSTEHVDDMWTLRQDGWYDESVNDERREHHPGDLVAEDLVIDKDLDGDWDHGHAYALIGTEGEASGQGGAVLINVRTENYMVELYVLVPHDPAKSQAARYGLDQEEIDSRTSLTFDRVEFVNWLADEHIYDMFAAVTGALADDSQVQRG